jgi:hypothetical protein
MAVVDVVAALNSDPCDVAILQQQCKLLQQPEIVGNTNIDNENQDRVGDDSVNNTTRRARENPHTGSQITIRSGTGKVTGYNKPGTEDCLGLASVPKITYLQEQLALRDAKTVAMEQRMSQLFHAVKDLQQRWWQPMLFIDMPERQQQIKPLGSYTVSPQGYDDKWGCTLTANDKIQFSGGKDDEHVLEEENKENMMPRDGRSQQYNASTPQTRRTRRRKIRDEEEQIGRPLKCVWSTKHPEGNTMAEKGSPYYRNFPESRQRNIHPTDNDSHANAGFQISDIICYSKSILQVIASCTHLTEFFPSPPSKDHQHFRLYYEFANVIHSMVTGRPDVVNPYNFVEIFKAYHNFFDANECTYVL